MVIALLCLVGFAYVLYVGLLTSKPERAVYGFLAAWLFVPKHIQVVPLLGGLEWEGHSVFEVLEPWFGAGLVAALLFGKRTPATFRGARRLAFFALLFLVTGLLSFGTSVGRTPRWGPAVTDVDFRELMLGTLAMVYGSLFLLACIRFIRNRRQVEVLLAILMCSSLELTAEVIALYYLRLFPGLDPWVIQESGRFQSLTFLSYDTVGLVSIVGVSASLYFVFSRRRYFVLPLVLLLLLPIVATFEKGPLLGVCVALAFVMWAVGPRRHETRAMIAPLVPLVLLLVVSTGSDQRLAGTLGGGVRPDYASGSSATRLGLLSRALDVLVAGFPFGTGARASPFYMGSPLVPRVSPVSANPVAREAYEQLATGEHMTSVHNLYVEFVVEHGLLGSFTMGLFGAILWRNFRGWIRRHRYISPLASRDMMVETCIYGAFAGFAVRYAVESGDKLYFLLLMCLHLTTLLPRIAGAVECRDVTTPAGIARLASSADRRLADSVARLAGWIAVSHGRVEAFIVR